MDKRARAAGDSSDGSSSSSSSDSVLIPMPLDQRHRKKLQAQLQLEQQKQKEQRADAAEDREKKDKKKVKKERPAGGGEPPARSKPKKERPVAVKSEHICVVCERGDGEPLIVCAGPCVSAFHVACLPKDKQAAALSSADADAKSWLCHYCRSKRHECFHCKEIGADQASGEEEGAASGTRGDAAASAKGPVRKCRALSCGKYYHLDCITQFPLARIAGTHFICPLHTCAGCDKSGAQKEAVRCVRCPVAYHASCLPAEGVHQLTSKLIVCPKHTGSSSSAVVVKVLAKDRESASGSRHQRSHSTDTTKKENLIAAVPDKDESSHRIKRRLDEIVKEDGAESEASERSAVSSTSTNDKKLHKSKKEKRDKKKKKKKKKMKRKDSRGRLASSSQDEESTAASGDEGVRSSRKAESSPRRASFEEVDESRRDSAVGSPPDKELKKESRDDGDVIVKVAAAGSSSRVSLDEAASEPPATNPSPYGADSPSLRASLLFESPATTKQRLVEVLGNSDDELDEEDTGKAPEVPSSLTTTESRASTVQTAIVQAKLEEKISARVEDSGESPRKDVLNTANDDDLEQKPLDRPSLSPPPPERSKSTSGSGPVDTSRDMPSTVTSSGDSPIGRIPNSPDTPSVKVEQVTNDTVESPKVERLAVKIPKSASSSSLTSAAKVGRSAKEAVSEGEEGDDEGPGGATTPRSRRLARIKAEQSAMGTPHGGTKSGSGGKKKKKKGKSSKTAAESDNDTAGGDELVVATGEGEAGGDEAKWVQCDNCKKWRTVPQSIDLASMPERWYCHMNSWNHAFASCDVAEEDVKQRTPQKAPSLSLVSDRSKKKSKKKKTSSSNIFGGTGSDGGSSSSSSAAGSTGKSGREAKSTAAAATITTVSTPDTGDASAQLTAKQLKKQEKQEKRKKRKLSKIKDKYRELKWVQCESAQCGKWRVVPSSIEFDLLPARWYCHLNTWAPELAKCTAPNPPEVEAFLQKQAAKDASASPATGSRSQSNKRPKSSSSASGDGVPTAVQTSGAASMDVLSSVGTASSGHEPGSKPAKSSKSAKASAQPSQAQQQTTSSSGQQQSGFKTDMSLPSGSSAGATVLSAVAVATGTTPHSIDTKTGAFQSGKSSSKSSNTGSSGTSSQVKKTVLEWAQCEKCNKWRKLPSHIKSSTLPDKWYCSMNHWDPARAKCSIPEEVEPEPLAVGPIPGTPGWYHGSVGNTKTGNGGNGGSRPRRGKLSYTELLYASTGQLRKTYTPESSTLSFEYEGVTYRRDDMYKGSSLYVSPEAMEKAITDAAASDASSAPNDNNSVSLPGNAALPTAWLGLAVAASTSDHRVSAPNSSTTVGISAVLFAGVGQTAQESTAVDRVASTVLGAMDLRREWSVSELFEKVNATKHDSINGGANAGGAGSVSLPLLAAALGELECKGQIERLDEEQSRAWKRRKTEAKEDGATLIRNDAVILYRKVPARPLKATKWWRTAGGTNSNIANASPLPTK